MGKAATAAEYDEVVAEAEEFEEVKGDFPPVHDFDETPELIGVYAGRVVKEIKGKDRTIHEFNVDGETVQAWGTAILDSRLGDVEPGSRVKVVKTGRKLATKGGNQAWEFKVFVARSALR